MPPSPTPVIPLSFRPRDCVYHRGVKRVVRIGRPAKPRTVAVLGAASMNQGGLVAVLDRVVGREQHALELIASIVQRGGSGEKAAAMSGQPAGHVLATGHHVLFRGG